MARKTEDFKFIMSVEQLKDFIKKLDDLTDINEKVIMKFDPQNLLLFTTEGKEKDIHAFKSHILSLKDDFVECEEIKSEIKFIINDGKKLIKNLDIYLTFTDHIHFKMIYNEDGFGEKLMMKNDKLKLDVQGALSQIFDINIEMIKSTMDINKAIYSFEMAEEDFTKIKKMSTVEKDNDVYKLLVKDNKIYIGENRWNLLVGDVEHENTHISFPKKYFNTIVFEESKVKLYVFETFLLYLGKESNLMITIEITI